MIGHAHSKSCQQREPYWAPATSDPDHTSDRVICCHLSLRSSLLANRNEAFATGALWLLGAGLVGAALAAVAGLTDFLGDGRIREISDAWHHAIGNVVLVLLQLFSFYWRSRNGASGVVPAGLLLSLIAIVLMAFTGWKGGELVFRHRVAVYDDPQR